MRMLRSNYFLLVLCVVGGALAVVAAYASCPNVTGVSIRCPSAGAEGMLLCDGRSGVMEGKYFYVCGGGGSRGYTGNFGTAESSGSQIVNYTYPNCWTERTCEWVTDPRKPLFIGGEIIFDGDCKTGETTNPGTAFVSDSCPEM